MSLVLSYHHHFSFFSKTPLHRRRHHHCYHRHPSHRLSISLHNINKTSPIVKTLNSHLQSTSNYDKKPLPKSAIQRIAEKLRTLGFEEPPNHNTQIPDSGNDSKIGEIYIPNRNKIPNYRVGHTLDTSWSSPQNPVPDPGSGDAIVMLNGLSRVAISDKKEKREKEKEVKVPSLAELSLSSSEIRRLTTMGIGMKQKMKLGKAGITEGIVNGIHERWRNFEVVKIVCEDICKLNMKRTHDLLERKTGGMVVWRSGSKIVLYRGVNYKYPYFSHDEASTDSNYNNAAEVDDRMEAREERPSSDTLVKLVGPSSTKVMGQPSLVSGVGSPNRVRFMTPGESQLVEEADRLLDGLGPRFTDWWGYEPLPIDADLLPAVVPGYRKPFRLLPYGVKPQLTNDEMTILKRLGRPLPCHFALGRNRNLQGLAAAILKLWEKCEIAKIAVKRGVQNTNSELMAEELKRLTGGILLSRDKEFMVFYRGKDFLPSAVSSAIEERRRNRTHINEVSDGDSSTVTKNNALDTEGHASDKVKKPNEDQHVPNAFQELKLTSIQRTIARTSRKLSIAQEEKARTEKLLSELEQAEISKEAEVDKEGITEEERYMLRKVGLRMKPFLLMGRRGVFDGTIENMHLHWKYRELVKIICGGRDIDEIHKVARILESESGGILVAVERVRKGHAIIVYRGKNYQRPSNLRPETLLNKKEALKRSIEAQRRESLKLNVLKLTKSIDKFKQKLAEDIEALDSKSGEQEEENNELNPIVSDRNGDSRKDSSIQQEKPSICPQANSNSVVMKQSSSEVDNQASCSKAIQVTSYDSGNASCYGSKLNFTSGPEEDVEQGIVNDEISKPSHESVSKEVNPQPLHMEADKKIDTIPARARALTNKERLLLRKIALKMKRRPVLAVGKSNVVTGIAKAIKDHFRKYPLAIVNVKGRAKGTSVREVVFKLEQETGGVLVSQEPSKIILYRGWGAGLEAGRSFSKEGNDQQASVPALAVSPELLAAMRVECGLPSD